jgi:hypothetical protein
MRAMKGTEMGLKRIPEVEDGFGAPYSCRNLKRVS